MTITSDIRRSFIQAKRASKSFLSTGRNGDRNKRIGLRFALTTLHLWHSKEAKLKRNAVPLVELVKPKCTTLTTMNRFLSFGYVASTTCFYTGRKYKDFALPPSSAYWRAQSCVAGWEARALSKRGNNDKSKANMRMIKNPVTVIVPPNIKAQLTGAWKCEKGASKTTLFYLDGTFDVVPNDKLDCDWDNWFSVVSAIQAASICYP